MRVSLECIFGTVLAKILESVLPSFPFDFRTELQTLLKPRISNCNNGVRALSKLEWN